MGKCSAKQSLASDLFQELKSGRDVLTKPSSYYIEAATSLPNNPELQRSVIEKAEREGLPARGIREVAKALRRATDEEEVQSILRQPVSRTEEQMVREAKV